MKKQLAALLSILAASTPLAAKEVPVYPGARADAAVAADLKKQMNIEGTFYRTGDSVAKVRAFYRKHLKEFGAANDEGATFTGDKVMVTVQNPWMDLKSGNLQNDTLISVVPEKPRR